MTEKKIDELEILTGYHFKNKDYLIQAMTHSSYANEHKTTVPSHNERLEFLGDAVLELISSDYLYHELMKESEGVLTKTRASIVCEPTLAKCARNISLDLFLLLGKGEESTGGRERDSILSDALEAFIGAVYLDGGLDAAKVFVEKYIMEDFSSKELFYDNKTVLQEKVRLSSEEPLIYELIGEEGPDHNKIFTVSVSFEGNVIGIGKGKTKKAAQQMAAHKALLNMNTKK